MLAMKLVNAELMKQYVDAKLREAMLLSSVLISKLKDIHLDDVLESHVKAQKAKRAERNWYIVLVLSLVLFDMGCFSLMFVQPLWSVMLPFLTPVMFGSQVLRQMASDRYERYNDNYMNLLWQFKQQKERK